MKWIYVEDATGRLFGKCREEVSTALEVLRRTDKYAYVLEESETFARIRINVQMPGHRRQRMYHISVYSPSKLRSVLRV